MKSSNADFAAAVIACGLALVALAQSAATPEASPVRSHAPAAPAPAHVRELLEGETLELNSANAADLMLLPAVGPKLAQRILAERGRRGGFKCLDDMLAVKGVGPATLARLRPWLRLDAGALSDRTAKPRSP